MTGMSLAPLDLMSAHSWQRVTFTTYALSLSFFEAVILDALIRGGGRQALILADTEGVRASLSEQGAQRVGKDYEVEPVAVSRGVFHPKISVLSAANECHLLVGSGNLTFGGWGGNFEVLEHLHPDFAADAIADAAEFFDLLSVTDRVRHGAAAHCGTITADLRAAVQGKPRNGNIRLFHSLDRSISAQLAEVARELGGATQLLAAAPSWDKGGAAIDSFCKAIGLDHVFVHAHPSGTVAGKAGSNWPFGSRSKVHPVQLEVMEDKDERRLHGKVFEIMCRRGRILVSGSANGTAAALDAEGNIEACVVRIQRDRSVGWKFSASHPPEPQAALDDGEEEERRRGILRAVLDADDIQGEVLTPAMSGEVSVFHVSSLGPDLLAKTTLFPDGRFQVKAPELEEKSWSAGRLVIRVEDPRGRQAEGFVSVASYAEITRRAGIVGRRLMAMLAGTETPADVAAIMSWFYEDPKRLSDITAEEFGGGSKDPDADKMASPDILVADLSDVAVAAGTAAAAGHNATKGSWSRFMELILSAFREKRGPFGRAGAGGKGDDDRDDDDLDGGDDDHHDDDRQARDEDQRDIEKSLVAFDRLFELLLRPDAETRQALIAFDLAQYICERLQPDAAQASRWLDKLIPALLKASVPPERRGDVALAVLSFLGMAPTPPKLRWARGCLLPLGLDLSGNAPASDGVRGFQAVLPQARSIAELWPQLQSIRTYPEQLRSFLAALKNGGVGEFTELEQAAPEEWPALKAALGSKDPLKRLMVLKGVVEYCPRCKIGLPLGEVGKLRSVGIATTKSCSCRLILIWPGA
jgi:hypothetical protein